MGLIKEEDHPWLFQIPHLRQLLEQLREHPQKEGAIDCGALDQPLAGEYVDIAPAIQVGAHPVLDVQLRFSEELLSSFVFKSQQGPLDGADAGGGNIAVGGGKLRPVIAHELEHGPQILQIQQQKPVVIGDMKGNVQHTGLNLGQAQQPGQQGGAHGGHGDPHRDSVFTEDIPESSGIVLVFKILDAEAFETLAHVGAVLSGLAHSGQIAFYIGQEHGDAHIGKGFCHHLHGDGLAGAGGAGDEAMAVCHGGQQIQVLLPLGQPNLFISVHRYFLPKAIGVLYLIYNNICFFGAQHKYSSF